MENFMNESHIAGCIGSMMQFAVAGYALRLNRRFGTARVGWSLFGAFSLLALLQLIQSTASSSAGTEFGLKVNVTYVLISFLLLIGLLHMETMLKQRLHVERIEHQLRAELQLEVKSKTAHLNRAIEELMSEIDESKRMAAIIDSSETRMISRPGDTRAEAAFKSAILSIPFGRNSENEQLLAGILGGEWIAHF
jgi:hypothetical protein